MIKSLSQKIIDAFLEHGNITDRDLVHIVKADGNSVRPSKLSSNDQLVNKLISSLTNLSNVLSNLK